MLVGVGSACSVLGGDDNDPASDSAAGVVDDLAVALSAHSLDDVPLTDDADRFDRLALYALQRHIEEEEEVLFSAAVFHFDGDTWDDLAAAQDRAALHR